MPALAMPLWSGRAAAAGDAGAGHAASLDATTLDRRLWRALSARTRDAIDAAPPGLKAAMLLASPEFMQR